MQIKRRQNGIETSNCTKEKGMYCVDGWRGRLIIITVIFYRLNYDQYLANKKIRRFSKAKGRRQVASSF